MPNSRSQFLALLSFLLVVLFVLTNGFAARISAQKNEVDVFGEIAPIAEVLDEILENYVSEPDPEALVEGALTGMMNSLDEYSAFVSPKHYQQITEDTMGEFEGIGVSIDLDKMENIQVQHPIAGSPAEKAGVLGGDVIYKIDGVSTKGMSTSDAADRIRGPKGTVVKISVLRMYDDDETAEPELLEFDIKRGKIPMESIIEYRMLDGGIAYIRVTDFKRKTAEEISHRIETLQEQGTINSLILDLRWNPGGLLNSPTEVCELFLPKGTLVTYTKSREEGSYDLVENMRFVTERDPILPPTVPIIVLTNEFTASSSEIMTGALQYWARALVIGENSVGKGSVQTLIELTRPAHSALRLTTGLYFTPGDVNINKQGIKPDIEVVMTKAEWGALLRQMRESYREDPNALNHGSVTGNEMTEDTVEDTQLLRAVQILRLGLPFDKLIEKFHQDTDLTQVAASKASGDGSPPPGLPMVATESNTADVDASDPNSEAGEAVR